MAKKDNKESVEAIKKELNELEWNLAGAINKLTPGTGFVEALKLHGEIVKGSALMEVAAIKRLEEYSNRLEWLTFVLIEATALLVLSAVFFR